MHTRRCRRILLAGWWHLSGFVVSGTRTLVCMVAAAALLAVFKLAQDLTSECSGRCDRAADRDLPSLVRAEHAGSRRYLRRCVHAVGTGVLLRPSTNNALHETRSWLRVMFSLAALSKETAIITPIALALWEASCSSDNRERTAVAASEPEVDLGLLAPILPLALWYAYH